MNPGRDREILSGVLQGGTLTVTLYLFVIVLNYAIRTTGEDGTALGFVTIPPENRHCYTL